MLNLVYKKALRKVISNGIESAPRGSKIKELLNYHLTVKNMLLGATHYASRPINYKYILAELLRYLSGDLKVDYIREFAKLWGKIADDKNEVNSNYGYLVFHKKNEHGYTQYQRVLDTLKKDKDSRQALMYYGNSSVQKKGVTDFICTETQKFFIRDNKLHTIVTMRSNDLFFGTPYDLLWFNLVTQSLYLDLKKTYPKLKLGQLHHNVGSLHIYEEYRDKAKQIIKEKGYNLATHLNSSLLSISKETIEKLKSMTLTAKATNKPQQYYKDILNKALPIYINYH